MVLEEEKGVDGLMNDGRRKVRKNVKEEPRLVGQTLGRGGGGASGRGRIKLKLRKGWLAWLGGKATSWQAVFVILY